MLSAGNPSRSPPACNDAASARFDSIASLPPRKIVAFPVLKQSDAASAVTFGLDSKMIPITPIGTRTFRIRIPFGLVQSASNSPTGSGNSATSSSAFAIASNRFPSSVNRSIIAALSPFARARSKSSAFALKISASSTLNCPAIARRIRFFCSVLNFTNSCDAARARRPMSRMAACRYIVFKFALMSPCLFNHPAFDARPHCTAASATGKRVQIPFPSTKSGICSGCRPDAIKHSTPPRTASCTALNFEFIPPVPSFVFSSSAW